MGVVAPSEVAALLGPETADLTKHLLWFGAIFCLFSCKEAPQEVEVWTPVTGEIQVLNSCGIPKVAGKVRDLLIKRGFDVVEIGNDSWWNFEETIIAVRNPHWKGAEALAKTLQTTNVILLENPQRMVDATVFLGKDIQGLFNE